MNVALPWARNRNAVERVPDAVEDLRGKVAEGAQQVAEVAGKLGREWGREAGKLGREVGLSLIHI